MLAEEVEAAELTSICVVDVVYDSALRRFLLCGELLHQSFRVKQIHPSKTKIKIESEIRNMKHACNILEVYRYMKMYQYQFSYLYLACTLRTLRTILLYSRIGWPPWVGVLLGSQERKKRNKMCSRRYFCLEKRMKHRNCTEYRYRDRYQYSVFDPVMVLVQGIDPSNSHK